jgi:hypothetical protein
MAMLVHHQLFHVTDTISENNGGNCSGSGVELEIGLGNDGNDGSTTRFMTDGAYRVVWRRLM